jgi:hypothetical protein
MSLESVDTKFKLLQTITLAIIAVFVIVSLCQATEPLLGAQSPNRWIAPNVSIPDESVGINGVVRTLISAFDQADVVALGEAHGHFRQEGDLRLSLIRNTDFAKKVRSIVVEFASTSEQATLDRYIRGESVSPAELGQVWKNTTQAANGNDIWESPIYSEFFAAVRDVNRKRPAGQQIRVLAGDPGQGSNVSREATGVSAIEQELKKHRKVLVIYGAAHFYRTIDDNYFAATGDNNDITKTLESDYPGRTFVVIPVGMLDRPRPVAVDNVPDYQKFDRALETQVRPVLVSLQRPPFRDFSVEEFLGRTVTTCRGPNGCVSAFNGSTLTLGQLADALIYFGGSDDAVERR